MSQASAQAFLDQIGKDPSLRAALLALNPGSARDLRASAEQLAKLAGQWGFDFSQNEIAEACAARAQRDESELDGAALADVARGTSQDALTAARFSLTIDGYGAVRLSLGVNANSKPPK